MKVQVDIGARRAYTYEAPDGTQVGDRVTVPDAFGGREPIGGRVVALGSAYEGPIVKVLSVRPAADPREMTP
jgi:primosomal protein N'